MSSDDKPNSPTKTATRSTITTTSTTTEVYSPLPTTIDTVGWLGSILIDEKATKLDPNDDKTSPATASTLPPSEEYLEVSLGSSPATTLMSPTSEEYLEVTLQIPQFPDNERQRSEPPPQELSTSPVHPASAPPVPTSTSFRRGTIPFK